MKDDNYIRQKIIELYFDKHLSISYIKYMVDKSEDFIEQVIAKHSAAIHNSN